MTTWSHLIIGTILYGPQPGMVAGTLYVDTFNYLNWVTRFFSGNLPLKLLRTNPEKFDQIVDQGILWQLHQIFNYSLWSLLASLVFAYYFHSIDNVIGFVFFISWAIHIGVDYFTHENHYPFYPLRLLKIKNSVINYQVKNMKKTLVIDGVLFVVMVLRLVYFS